MRGFDYSILQRTAHRPWPLPSGPWVMTQTWHDLLFAHWPVPAPQVRSKIPEEFTLDAGSPLAVHAGRTMLNLPYFTASMSVTNDGAIRYDSRRDGSPRDAEFSATFAPTGPSFAAPRGSLEYFLTERYCFYNRNHHDEPYRLDIHHPPWPLRPVHAEFAVNTMAEVHGLALPDELPLLHFVERQDMVAWMPMSLVRRMNFALDPLVEREG